MSVVAQKAYKKYIARVPSNELSDEEYSVSDSSALDEFNSFFVEYNVQREPTWLGSLHGNVISSHSTDIQGSVAEAIAKQLVDLLYRERLAAGIRKFGRTVQIKKQPNIPSISGEFAKQSDASELQEQFRRLCDEWREATEIMSSSQEKIMHPAYQRIIGLGPKVIPLVLSELRDNGGHWFWALQALTGENPVKKEDAGRVRKMTESWLNWGKEKGLM